MADFFQLYKDAINAKEKARQKKDAAAAAKKKSEEAWELLTEQYEAYKKFSDLRPEDKGKVGQMDPGF